MSLLKKFLTFDDVGLIPKFNKIKSRLDVNLSTLLSKNVISKIPLIPANMDSVIGTELAKVLVDNGGVGIFHRFTDIEKRIEFHREFPTFFQSCGITDWENTKILLASGCKNFCIDIAHGHSEMVADMIKKIKLNCPDAQVIAGNVCTPEGFQYLVDAGADSVKVGVGPGCCGFNTRILMANGIYKNIQDVKINDFVINKDGKPVRVLNVMNQGIKNVIKIRNNLHYKESYFTKNHEFFIGDLSSCSDNSISSSGIAKLLDKEAKTTPKSSKYKWKELFDCKWNNTVALFPKIIDWKLEEDFIIDLSNYLNKGIVNDLEIITTGKKEKTIFNRFLKSSYDLGYIFGTFLGDGCARNCINSKYNTESGSINWYFGIEEENICNKLSTCIKNILNIDVKFKKLNNKNVNNITLYNKCLTQLLITFGKKTEKHLPPNFYCKNKEYIKGLFDGLVDSDGHIDKTTRIETNTIYCFTNTSPELIELFQWCCINLNISFTSSEVKGREGNLKGITENSVFNSSYRTKTHTFNRYTKSYLYSNIISNDNTDELMETWDLEVDCDTHSFVANNMIVHNSACSTRMVTGVGVPQFSAIQSINKIRNEYFDKTNIYIPIIADGGIRDSRDICLALASGGDTVMMGSLFCKTFESVCYKEKDENGETWAKYRGQASQDFQQEYFGGLKKGTVPEGISFKVKITKSAQELIDEINGSLRSSMTYLGASTMSEYHENAEFFESTMNYLPESKPRKEK